MIDTPEDVDAADCRERVELLVAAGFDDDDEITDRMVEWLEHDPDVEADDGLEDWVRTLVDEAVAAHEADRSRWPAVTDCDRLATAFAELGRAGVMVLQDFWCCVTCAEEDLANFLLASGPEVHGYAYFHEQDTERAVRGGGLLLSYGCRGERGWALDGPEWQEATRAVGSTVVAALRSHGLQAQWDGDTTRRIEVPIDWKCRRGVLERTPGGTSGVDLTDGGGNDEPAADPDEAVVAHLRRGERVAAMLAYRQATSATLQQARDAVDELARRNGL